MKFDSNLGHPWEISLSLLYTFILLLEYLVLDLFETLQFLCGRCIKEFLKQFLPSKNIKIKYSRAKRKARGNCFSSLNYEYLHTFIGGPKTSLHAF